ncbi:bifunctional diaminohydroxyphosphoribosylaminopyrimidine deaminase/5-amino-6-(5-phosphoribosylamino)uracil reductase RibD [Sphingobacterium chuzhouense]|uniref:Riboflavin biosynthesis protein RibD n=1 Tax=Sphingobacterium chuzhouense TaxID=1742264 RepID=A0ABR7XV31_9SPHI|nr:bifunctional diaminohydroxyphosphoribosylaminopyrimidine deaminase/5-amino-6-(5-phosphoribosylamino)uracil reductase RibD [Sphingobacterium chuzhouense]MBD1422901.1 bifunctional diaminohydroxyphosphoribosylaminopyrimidine deaminase/5-amino-6-(5-phosphoribosylamino)uracil reductase RibD [Sphingobacterium chuzhouense]
MVQDERYMQRCLDLATLGAGTVSPNPMVGAVILHDNLIIGEGYTSPYGGPHAEVNAVQDAYRKLGEAEAKILFRTSTMYVSLEPCSHFGKTPPCADMLVELQFKRVVIGCLDPFTKVNGQGVKKLQQAGIDTTIGVLEDTCTFTNRRFFTRIQQQRPYVILKWAQTEDGFFSPEDVAQQWISNKASKQLVHKWRGEEDAILVGTSTALIDNPVLTTRLWNGKNPKRILIDKELKVSADAAIFNEEAETIVFNAHQTEWRKNRKLIALEHFDLYLPQQMLYQLYLMDVQSLIVEGGAKTLQSFIDAGIWDEARVFISRFHWGQGKPAPQLKASICSVQKVGNDDLKIYFNGEYA